MKLLAVAVLVLAVGTAAAAPVINQGGILNAASFGVPDFPNGAIARGATFSIFGDELGPQTSMQQPGFPLSTELGSVTVTITGGGGSVNAIPVFVFEGQINAIMPSNAPLGEVEIVVTFNGEASSPASATVVDSSFAAFTANGNGVGPAWVFNFVAQDDQPQNTALAAGEPGQVVTVWGTGLGPIDGADNVRPADVLSIEEMNLLEKSGVQVFVGGVPATNVLYAGRSAEFPGLDQVIFEIPAQAPRGCWVPVIVVAGGIPSPSFTMSIGAEGGVCSDVANPFSQLLIAGGDLGALLMVRAQGALALPLLGNLDFLWDVFVGNFAQQPGGPTPYNLLMSLPPIGACATANLRGLDLTAIVGGQLPDLDVGTEIDGGPGLTLTRVEDATVVEVPRNEGRYVRTAGGGLLGPSENPPFFNPGAFRIESPGGPDVGSFSVDVSLPEVLTWSNPDELEVINRSQGATFSWSGGDPSQLVALAGANLDLLTGNAAAFYCIAPNQLGAFTVSPAVLGGLPASRVSGTLGFVALGVIPTQSIASFVDENQPPSLEAGIVLPVVANLRTGRFE